MPRLISARHRIRNAWVASLVLALALVSCWKVDPALVVSTTRIDFATTKITNPITIRNGSEDNRALADGVVTLEYKITSNQPWLTVSPLSGACGSEETATHTVSVDRSQMEYGQNTGTIAITSNGGSATISVRAVREVPGCDTEPTPPIAVYPASGASNIGSNIELSWGDGESQCSQLTATYDVYFGTTSPPPFDHDNDSLKTWNPGPLAHNTTYFWRIVVKDANGEVKGPQWTFQTTCDLGPNAVTLLSPADDATEVGVNDDISWSGGTSQCLGLTSSYDVYFGTITPPPFHHNTTSKYWDPGVLKKGETYYWKIVAKDAHGSNESPVRSFTTSSCMLLPLDVQLLTPLDGAVNIPITQSITWAGGASQCGLAGSFDVYFGTTSPPPFRENTTLKYWAPGTLANSTKYYWKIVAKDGNGSTSSVEHSFTTTAFVCTQIPGAVTLTSPASGASNVALDQDLAWSGGDSQCADETATYDVYFGTSTPPPFDHNNGTGKTWSPVLQYDTKYYWRIVARDNNGAKSSETRSFTTPCHLPPSAVNLISPNDGATGTGTDASLSWGGGNNQCPGMTAPTYDVYFGTTSNPPFKANTSLKYWEPGPLQTGVKYFWKIIAKDANGTTSSPVHSFTTASNGCTLGPAAVTLLGPADGATVTGGGLSWSGGGSQCAGLTSTYDVYFGTTSPPPLDHNNETSTTWTAPLTDNTTYYWRIVAKDDNGSASSEQRSFKTPCTAKPSAVTLTAPANLATGVGIDNDISWTGGNSACAGLIAVYDVYFGTTSTPVLAESNVSAKTWDPGTLTKGATYYWKIVAKDDNGTTSSAVWRFQTELPPCLDPPLAACNPSPANNATNRNRDSNLSWGCGTTQCGKTVTYDVYFGKSAALTEADKVGSTASKSWALPHLEGLTKYYWKVIARDANGPTSSPVWSFTTKS